MFNANLFSAEKLATAIRRNSFMLNFFLEHFKLNRPFSGQATRHNCEFLCRRYISLLRVLVVYKNM